MHVLHRGLNVFVRGWRRVNTKTRGTIPRIIDELGPLDVAVLVNAMYFKGTWASAFNAKLSKPAKFGGRKPCTLMYRQMKEVTRCPVLPLSRMCSRGIALITVSPDRVTCSVFLFVQSLFVCLFVCLLFVVCCVCFMCLFGCVHVCLL